MATKRGMYLKIAEWVVVMHKRMKVDVIIAHLPVIFMKLDSGRTKGG